VIVRALLLGVFDVQILLECNLKGGKSKRTGCQKRILQPFDEQKLEAIYILRSVKVFFVLTFCKSNQCQNCGKKDRRSDSMAISSPQNEGKIKL
jgi:hypothetical protein